MSRPLAEIEQDIRLARRERELFVSPQGVTGIHAKIDHLLDERDEALLTTEGTE